MTVNELIEQLKSYPGDMVVVIPGYEGGYDNPSVCVDGVDFDANWDGKDKTYWYMGRHHRDYDWKPQNGEPNVVVIGRGE